MDSKQFDELVARLAGVASRRNAVKGALGGALASVGVTSVAAEKGGKGNGKGKGKGKNGKRKGRGNKGKGSEKQVTICHRPPGDPGNCHTMTVGAKAAEKHVAQHGDTFGECPYAC
jgi:hypothetical protein